MEISTILTADALDIIFDGRNKEYGAYDLRKSYQKRLLTSISVMLSVIGIALIAFAFTNKKEKSKPVVEVKDIVISTVDKKPEQPVLPPPPPPKLQAPPPQVQTIKFATPVIVNQDVPDEDKPPVNADVADVKIGLENKDGIKGDDVVAPPADVAGTGVIETPKREDDDPNKVWMKVEIESQYPGGMAAWARFLHKNLNYPQEAIDNGIEGYVTVKFVVDQEGNVSNIEVISGPEELRAEAIRVIKKSGKWTPAVQNGRKVASYKQQPLGFALNKDEQ